MTAFADRLREQAERALPQTEGRLHAPGLREPVEVVRDEWGVPHIYARSLEDMYFAQGFVAASERLFQIDFTFRLATGRLAEILGELALPIDRFARTIGWNRAGERIASDSWNERSHEIARSWWAGVLASAAAGAQEPPLEYAALDLSPRLPKSEEAVDQLASVSVYIAWTLSNNWDAELLRLEVAERLGWEAVELLFPETEARDHPPTGAVSGGAAGEILRALREVPLPPSGQGSNNWVVAGSRSVTGHPLLANDPHLTVQMPSVWFECHLSAPGFDCSGGSLPYAPGIPVGRTSRIAWGVTNVGGDTQDLYLERLNPEGDAALYDGKWEPLAKHVERIEVRGKDEPVTFTARESRHGPLIDSYMIGFGAPKIVEGGVGETFALRWVGLSQAMPPSALERVALATDFEEFREAVRTWTCPGNNFVYADTGGNIGYQCSGTYPVRPRGNGTLPVPGWSSDYDWIGTIPFEELPTAYNPPEGFIATANERIHRPDYPHLIGEDFLPPFRSRRIAELIEQTAKHSRESFAAMQMDTASLPARHLVPLLLERLGKPQTARQITAAALLSKWDFDLGAESAAACIYEAWGVAIANLVLRPKLGEDLFDHYYARRQWTNTFQFQVLPRLLEDPAHDFWPHGARATLSAALDDALDDMTNRLGPEMAGWRWGSVHRVVFDSQLSFIPEAAELLVGDSIETAGDEQTVHQSMFEPGAGYDARIVPSWRQIIDLSDPDEAVGIHTTGQSGNPASEHYLDMTGPWSRGEYHPMPFTRGAVERHAKEKLLLTPEAEAISSAGHA